jgi:hypothetical protein
VAPDRACQSQECRRDRDHDCSAARPRLHEVGATGGVVLALTKAVLFALVASLRACFRSRASLQLEILALRHQLAVYQRRPARARVKVADRFLPPSTLVGSRVS